MNFKLLVVLILALSQAWASQATNEHAKLHHMVKERIKTHMREHLETKQSNTAVGSMSPSRHLQALPVIGGRKLLIYAEYQLQQLDPGTAAYVQSIVGAAIQNIQMYLSLNTSSPPGPLLVPPMYYGPYSCDEANKMTSLTGKNCSSEGFTPDFSTPLPPADVRSPYCGPARLNPSHSLNTSCLDGACQKSGSGGPGLTTDYYLYVTSDVSGSCNADLGSGSATAAFGIPCFFDSKVGRPILGAFNICPIAFQVYTTSARLINVITHEMLHAMGFNDALAPYFAAATNGNANLIMRNIPPSPTLQAAGKRNNYQVMISPAVVREARAQFNCPTLEGAPMEDQGGLGSAGEARSFPPVTFYLSLDTSSSPDTLMIPFIPFIPFIPPHNTP